MNHLPDKFERSLWKESIVLSGGGDPRIISLLALADDLERRIERAKSVGHTDDCYCKRGRGRDTSGKVCDCPMAEVIDALEGEK